MGNRLERLLKDERGITTVEATVVLALYAVVAALVAARYL